MMRPWIVVALMAAVAFSGCTDGSDSEGPGTDGSDGTDDQVLEIQKPEWQVGDWWTFDSTFGTQTVVVTGENSGNWVMDTDNAQFAFFHSTFQEISYLGEVRKDDLSGSQDGTPVRYFDWPLQDGKTWTTQWDGIMFDMVAHVGDEGTAHIVASSDTATYDLVYKESAKWFTAISFKDADGTETGRMDLTESGSGFAGEAIRVDAEVLDEKTYTGVQSQSLTTYDPVEAEDADAYLTLEASCTEPGHYAFAVGTVQSLVESGAPLGTFENQGHTVTSACPSTYGFTGVVGLDPGNGDQWGHLISSESSDLELTFTLYVRHFERIVL